MGLGEGTFYFIFYLCYFGICRAICLKERTWGWGSWNWAFMWGMHLAGGPELGKHVAFTTLSLGVRVPGNGADLVRSSAFLLWRFGKSLCLAESRVLDNWGCVSSISGGCKDAGLTSKAALALGQPSVLEASERPLWASSGSPGRGGGTVVGCFLP